MSIFFESGAFKKVQKDRQRISAVRFLFYLIAPALVLLLIIFMTSFYHLKKIEKFSTNISEKYLPEIMDSQNLLAEVLSLQTYAKNLRSTDDSVFQDDFFQSAMKILENPIVLNRPEITSLGDEIKSSFRKLAEIKTVQETVGKQIKSVEWRLAAVAGSLEPEALFPSEENSSADQAFLPGESEVLDRAEKICQKTSSQEDEDLCLTYRENRDNLEKLWTLQSSFLSEEKSTWKEIDSDLEILAAFASSSKAEHTQKTLQMINEESFSMRFFFLGAVIAMVLMILAIAFVIHRSIFAPIAFAALNLRKIRFGLPPINIPAVPIKELYELFSQLPGLSRHMENLNARTSSLEKEKLRYANLSLLDGLTGIPNRRSLELAMEEDSGGPAAVLMIDVDFFKRYNDSLGHQAGDACLIAIAQALQSVLHRTGDSVFRYGGEEFVMLLPDVNSVSAEVVAQRVLEAVRNAHILHPDSSIAPEVTVSVGFSARSPEKISRLDELIHQADIALYHAKSSGRNRALAYQPDMAQREKD